MKKPTRRDSGPKQRPQETFAEPESDKASKNVLPKTEQYVRFTDLVSEKPEEATFDVGPRFGRGIDRERHDTDVSDAELIVHFDKVCAAFGCSRTELLGLLSNKRYGSTVRLGLDRALEIEARTLSGRRPPRRTKDLADPGALPSAEINRRDKRVVANIPERLTLKFAEVREEAGANTLKEAFHTALADWLEADRPESDLADPLLIGGNALFQVRVELATANALEQAAKAAGLPKRECVQAALLHYVNNKS